VHTYAVQSRLNAAECGIFRGRRRAVWLCNEKDYVRHEVQRSTLTIKFVLVRLQDPRTRAFTRFDTGDLQSSAEMSVHLHLLYSKPLECHFKFSNLVAEVPQKQKQFHIGA
jgi:hypothetical protein